MTIFWASKFKMHLTTFSPSTGKFFNQTSRACRLPKWNNFAQILKPKFADLPQIYFILDFSGRIGSGRSQSPTCGQHSAAILIWQHTTTLTPIANFGKTFWTRRLWPSAKSGSMTSAVFLIKSKSRLILLYPRMSSKYSTF